MNNPTTISANYSRLLIVDDEEPIINLIEFMLDGEPFVIQSAATGYEAVIKAQTFQPSLVLLDINLVGQIDGLTVLKKLKELDQTRDIPILLISGDSGEVMHGFDLGAADFLIKPFSRDQLIETMSKYLAHNPLLKLSI